MNYVERNVRYKLTTQENTTHNGTDWWEDCKRTVKGKGPLCSEGWLHVYTHPLLAILLNPIHGSFRNPKLWECEVYGKCLRDRGLKEGWEVVRTVRVIPLPQISLVQKVAFGILCTKEVFNDKEWIKWAENWLSGKNRTAEAAWAAGAAKASWAAARAARAAGAATWAAADAATWAAADAATWAARATTWAAEAAAGAAEIDLVKIAKEAMKCK